MSQSSGVIAGATVAALTACCIVFFACRACLTRAPEADVETADSRFARAVEGAFTNHDDDEELQLTVCVDGARCRERVWRPLRPCNAPVFTPYDASHFTLPLDSPSHAGKK